MKLGFSLLNNQGIDDVQAAFELACRPVPGRAKIAIVASWRIGADSVITSLTPAQIA